MIFKASPINEDLHFVQISLNSIFFLHFHLWKPILWQITNQNVFTYFYTFDILVTWASWTRLFRDDKPGQFTAKPWLLILEEKMQGCYWASMALQQCICKCQSFTLSIYQHTWATMVIILTIALYFSSCRDSRYNYLVLYIYLVLF